MYDVTKPRIVFYETKGKVYQNAVYWVNLTEAQKKGLTFYQTQSNAIILHDSVPANFIAMVVDTRSKEILHESTYLTPRPAPKIGLRTAWQVRHEGHQQMLFCSGCAHHSLNVCFPHPCFQLL